jgi:signal transduction histidine kinase
MLFDEVRGVATAEERRRLAREIHDGIAQELSYLGYVVDSLTAEATDIKNKSLTDQLRDLRREITRIVSELRLSIFDLRSEVDTHGGLGSALSDYVRSVGQQSDLTVHLSLDEAANRLPAETEAELLRIAQEAITNARKHAEATNLWVTLVVDPPSALLRVEDDGRGLGKGRHDSFGLSIMRERASRLRTSVQVEPREPRGTRVEVVLGGPTPATTRLTDVSSQPRHAESQQGLEELPST